MAKLLKGEVKIIQKISPIIYRMTIGSEYITKNAAPGQFINIKCSEGINPLLRRPISICNVNRQDNTFDIVFQIKGVGTEYLSQKKVGSEVDLIAPLGTQFDISQKYKKIAVVGGGIGIFPLLFLLNERQDAERYSFLGFRNKDYIVLKDEFEKESEKLLISTDDGSEGHRGLIIDLLEQELKQNKFDIIYTCGPTQMIKAVTQIAEKNSIKCQVSLEQRMGCGIGACLVCACKTKQGDDWKYSHVCKDGPIFWSDEVVFED